ncbi:MAG: glutaredoxin family protein [Gammaproteobacteria bacterium]
MNRPLTLYYRIGCHLCEQMLAELYALYGEELPIRLVDVDNEAALTVQYGSQVPVLMGGERLLGSGKLDRIRLEEYLEAG